MLIAQISDFHVTAPGQRAYGRVDTNRALARMVKALNSLEPQPDLVIGTGDLTQTGSDLEYATLRQILRRLRAPFAPVMGNHDRRTALRRAFADFGTSFGPDGFIQYALDLDDLRIVVLDTVREGSDDPEFCAQRAAWLAGQLAGERPTIVVMHHPPFRSGLGWLDPQDAGWSNSIGDLVQGAPNVVRIVSGHVHRAINRMWRGVAASTAPSTAHQVALDLTSHAPPELSLEAPGFQLHRWDGRDVVSYSASVEGFSKRFTPSASAGL